MNTTYSWIAKGSVAAAALVAVIVGCSSTPGQAAQTCGAVETLCGKECIDTLADPSNCGACGAVCKPGEVCGASACSLTCGAGSTQCGASCFDTNVDGKNCGACGTSCSVGQICAAAKCVAQCPAQQTLCVGDGGAISCINPNTDAKNCGGCGAVCDPGKVCGAGKCGDTCGVNELLCKGTSNTLYCSSVQTDNNNCGTCGKACTAGQACVGGNCTGNCGLNEKLCPSGDGGAGYCAKTDTDQANCGACGTGCNSSNGEICVAGKCILQCAAGLTQCGKECVDIKSSRDNCGGCNSPCSGLTPVCAAGKCVAQAPCDPNTEVVFSGHCYYIDGSGGKCDVNYALGSNATMAAILGNNTNAYAGKNYKHQPSSNCCMWTSDASEVYGMNAHCNSNGPFSNGEPVVNGAGCNGAKNFAIGQLTFCGSK